MVDNWVEAFENDEITAVILCDQSAAFDVCDHKILLDKLKIYGLQDGALTWFSSYLENRSQRVYIEGALSDVRNLDNCGVPQGGNLSPLLYNVFCSDLPLAVHEDYNDEGFDDTENAHDEEVNDTEKDDEQENHSNCNVCGKLVCYADDCTYSSSHVDPVILQNNIK